MLSIIKFQYSRRKEHLEQFEKEEAARLRERYQQTKAQYSVVSDFIKIIKWKALKYAIFAFGAYFAYQMYDTADIYFDKKIRILPLKAQYERPLADTTINLLQLEKNLEMDSELAEKVKPYTLFVLDENYPIFTLFPNDVIVANKKLLRQVNSQQIQQLIQFCKTHNELRTSCNLLDLKYIPTLTFMKLRSFINLKKMNQIVLAREYFFLPVPEELEIQNEEIQRLMRQYKNVEQGPLSFILQHQYIL
ncbi:unnamed protein product (macronuclear) [Paramecium tetraurelia]|uniref:Uncharacterized protein n=1 Tax=Paramecium tetraurelia TaxID=5888 RepID=A0BLB6_PARTE|nr:uncharacterized protein GSPATT00029965001 [Paramecium tetraurelia]CAK59333.1 unnamed protein product [Paramecium tetraurelia]|eukprot:XP_001426731.1 hypothetical protein (macronuclear) [Paramecium tetraurelia strain d4-2]